MESPYIVVENKMGSVYIVVENGEAYPVAYMTYKAAVKAVKEKNREILEDHIQDVKNLELIESILSDVNVPEDKVKNTTHLYIEKGINILIHKLPIT
jgi:hypothetical protein